MSGTVDIKHKAISIKNPDLNLLAAFFERLALESDEESTVYHAWQKLAEIYSMQGNRKSACFAAQQLQWCHR